EEGDPGAEERDGAQLERPGGDERPRRGGEQRALARLFPLLARRLALLLDGAVHRLGLGARRGLPPVTRDAIEIVLGHTTTLLQPGRQDVRTCRAVTT